MENVQMDLKQEEAVPHHGTLLSSYSVLCKSMIGSGIFAMAGACGQFGLIPGVLALCIAAGITWLSLHVLSILALEYRLENPSFYSVSEKILPRAKWVLDVALIINCFGAAVAYVITSGTLMSFAICAMFKIPKDAAFGQSQIAMIVQAVMILALAPLCMLKEISSTKVANLIGLTCLLYIVIVTFVYANPSANAGDSDLLWPASFLGAMGSFPTFIFAFACQQNVFTVANELADASRKRLAIVCASSTLTGFLVYVPMMLIPFLTYGRGVEDNYLKNLDTDGSIDVPVILAFVLASFSVSISYVLQVHPVRRSVISLIFGAKEMATRKERTVRIGMVTLIMVASYALAVGLGSNLSLPINLAGLLGGNTMCFVMPFLMFLRRYGWRSPFAITLACVLAFCLALYPLCLTGIIYDFTRS
jgi:amino acid permease